METKLSLLEISSEDLNLLQKSPINDIAIFNCSPFSLSSFNASTSGNTCSQIKGSALTYSNKENLCNNENKSGMPNLSVEPLKMKRSKKAGGYNLRKSLAWDKAFLTEQGVLNDSELSLITGTIDDRDSLPVIDQQGRDSLPVNYGTVCGSADTVITDENLASSGFPKKRNATSSSSVKRDSLIGSSLPLVSKSSNKVSPGHGFKKTASQGEVCSTPMVSASQKRLLNTGTKKIFTRSSKIPKVPVSRKTSSVASMTPFQYASDGSGLKCTEIAQSAPRKSLISNLQSKTKHVSGGAKLLEPVPKSIKHSADVGNDSTNSVEPLHSLMSHKAEYTTKVSKCSEIKSSELPGGVNTFKDSDGKLSTTTSSNVENVSLNKKNFQGTKPSGLRLPSPSLRFFSETKAPSSSSSVQVNNTKPSLLMSKIPTLKSPKVADNIHDIKPTKLLHGSLNVDAMGKGVMCLQKTDSCSTSSNVAPKVCAKEIQVKCNQQGIELQSQQVQMNIESTNDKQCEDKGASSLKAEKSSTKDNISNSFQVEFKEASSKATILHDKRTSDSSMMDDSLECCPEIKLMEAFETTTEAQPQRTGDVEFNSAVTNIDVMPELQTNLIRHHKELSWGSDIDLSSCILDNKKVFNESDNCRLDQTCSQRNLEVLLGERNLLDDESSVRLDYDHSAIQSSTHDFDAVQSIINCSAHFSVAVGSKYDPLDVKKGDEMFDSKVSTMNLSEGSEVQDKSIEPFDKQERSSTNSEIKDDKDVCSVILEVEEQSDHKFSTLPELSNEDPGDLVHLCKLDHVEEQSQSSRHGIIDNGTSSKGAATAEISDKDVCPVILEVEEQSDHMFSALPELSNEDPGDLVHLCKLDHVEYNYSEDDRQQVFDNSLLGKEMMLQDYSHHDIDKVSSCTEELEEEIDFPSCVPNNANSFNLQTTHLEFQSSEPRSKDAEEFSCQENQHELPPKDVLMSANFEEVTESDEAQGNISPREAEMKTSRVNDGLAGVSASNMEYVDEADRIAKQKASDKKLARLPSNVVPFSDEWLAAIESAGEEILTLKTGAVKHSPPDKSIPEPSPWSPVKKKNNQVIGPFDCTKYTNN